MVNVEGSPVQTRNVFAILVKVFGLLLLSATIGTVISLVYVNDMLANSTHVDGQVVALSHDTRGRRAPIVQFKIANGEILQLQSTLYTSPAPNVGDTVKVLYRSSNPRDWQIDDWIHLYFWTFLGSIFMFAWAMALTITTVACRSQIRKQERAGASHR